MRINDEEDLLRSIQAFVKTNLNAKIAEINAKKTDFEVEAFEQDDDTYVFAGELQDLPNRDFVNFAIAGDVEIENNQDDRISLPVIIVEACFDNQKAPNTYFKSLRYMRALYEVMLGYEATAIEVGGLQITKAIPMPVTTATKRQLMVSGVILSASLG